MKLTALLLALPLSGCCGALCYFSKAIDARPLKRCETAPPGPVCGVDAKAAVCWECHQGIWSRYHREGEP
jgi:hypothetical protein